MGSSNPGSVLSLGSNVIVRDGTWICEWLLLTANMSYGFDLESISLSPSTRAVVPTSSLLGNTFSFPLVASIAPTVFTPGATYAFRLIISSASSLFAVYDDVSVIVNIPPSQGSLRVHPPSGYGLLTTFQLSAVDWQSTSGGYPLSYRFSYQVTRQYYSNYISAANSTSPTILSLLPTGTRALNYLISLQVMVADAVGASSSANQTVKVLPDPLSDTASLVSIIAGSSDQYLTDIVISTLNSNSSLLTSTGGYCTADDQCVSNACINSYCGSSNISEAQCPTSSVAAECSGHGRCQFTDGVGRHQANCSVGNSFCVAICACDSGHAGAGCEFTAQQFLEQDQVRSAACKAINAQTYNENSFPLLANSYQVGAVSESTTMTCFQALTKISENTTSNTDYQAWAQSISSFTEYLRISMSRSNYTPMSNYSITGENVSMILDAFTASVTRAEFDGMATSYITSAFTIVLEKLPLFEFSNATFVSGQSSITLPASGLQTCGASASSRILAVAQWNINPYFNSSALVTPLLRLTVGERSGGAQIRHPASGDTFFLQLPFISPQDIIPQISFPNNYTIPVCRKKIL